jgi:hypothetical protein
MTETNGASAATQGSLAGGAVPASSVPRRRRWLRGLLIVLGLLVLGVALLPTLLSTGPVRRLALRQVNGRIPGTLELADWSLGWFSGFRLAGIVLRDPAGAMVVEVESVTVTASVPQLLGSTHRLGTVTVSAPRIDLILYPDGGSNLLTALRTSQPSDKPRGPDSAPGESGPPLAAAPLAVVGDIAVRNGEISVRVPDIAPPFTIHELNSDLHLDRLDQPIRLTIKALLGESRAAFEQTTTVANLLQGPDALATDTTLSWIDLDLAEFAPLARHFGVPVNVVGVLDGNLTAQTQGKAGIQAVGHVVGRNLSATGGPLGKDRPTLKTVSLDFDLAKADRTLTIAKFALISPLATADASGDVTLPAAGGIPTGNLTAVAVVHVAPLAAQLPGTLKLHEGMVPVAGKAMLNVKLTSDADRATAIVALRLEDLAATRQGQRIELDQPVIAAMKASFSPQGPEIETLQVTSAFVNATGKGNLDDFSLRLTSDLAAARREAAKFIDLGAVTAGGTADLTLRLQKGEGADRKLLESVFTLASLDLAGLTPAPLRLDKATLSVRTEAVLTPERKLRELRNFQADLASSIAQAAVHAERITPVPGAPPEIVGGKIDATANLADLAGFAIGIGVLPADLSLGGNARFATGLAIQDGLITADPITLEIPALMVKRGDKQVSDPNFSFGARAEVAPQQGNVDFSALSLSSQILRFKGTAALHDWKGARRLSIDGDLGCDFDRLGPMVAALSGKPVELGGQDERPFHLATSLSAKTLRERILATTATFGGRLARAGYDGIAATDVDMPSTIRDGIARTDGRGALGGGAFLLPATLDANAESPALTLPADTAVLSGVDMTNEAIGLLLSKFVPIFNGTVAGSGKVSLLSRECRIPIQGDILAGTRFDGILAFSGGRMEAVGFLREALAMARLEKEAVTLPNQRVVVKVQDGKALHEPLLLSIGGVSVEISGGLTLADRQLDYWIVLPVTPALLGDNKSLYELLKGESIRVHVAGPANKPKVARDTFQENLSRLIRRAAPKLLEKEGKDLLRQGLQDFLNKKKKKK